MPRFWSGRRDKYDVVRKLRALRRRADALAFPSAPWEGLGYHNWKIPVPSDIVQGPSARRPVQAVCAQVLIDTAARLATEKPAHLSQARVAAILGWPDLFASEVCVFFDPAAYDAFRQRDDDWQRWTPRADQAFLQFLDLRVPPGFGVEGFDTLDRDDDPPQEITGQIWLIGEV